MLNSKNIQYVNIPRFTFNVWKKMYPRATRIDYDNTFGQELTMQFVLSTMGDLPFKVHIKGRIVAVDDEYLDWLKANQKSCDQQNSMEYMDSLSEEDIDRLFIKNGWDNDCLIMGIPLLVLLSKPVEKTEFMLSEDARRSLLSYLEKIYGEHNVYLTNYIMKMDDFHETPRPFFNIAKGYFESGLRARFGSWEEQNFSQNTTALYLFLPYAVRWHYESAVFDIHDIYENRPYRMNMDFDKRGFDIYYIEDVEDFEDTNLSEVILSSFLEHPDIVYSYIGPYSIMLQEIPEEKEFLKALEKEMRQDGKHRGV